MIKGQISTFHNIFNQHKYSLLVAKYNLKDREIYLKIFNLIFGNTYKFSNNIKSGSIGIIRANYELIFRSYKLGGKRIYEGLYPC